MIKGAASPESSDDVGGLILVMTVVGFSALLYFMCFSLGYVLEAPIDIFGKALTLLVGGVGTLAGLKIDRLPFLWRMRFYGTGGLVMLVVLAVASVALACLAFSPALFGAYGVVTGLLIGLLVQWWVFVWGALYFAGNKRKTFVALMAAPIVAGLLALTTYGTHPGLGGNGLVAFVYLFMALTIACATYLLRLVRPVYDEFSIEPEQKPDQERFRVTEGARPLMTINCGVAAAFWLVMVAQLKSWDLDVFSLAALLVAGIGLCLLALTGKSIPRIEWVDGLVSFACGCAFLLVMLGNYQFDLGIALVIGIFVTLYVLCLFNGCASFVPLFSCRPMEACGALLANLVIGLVLGLGVTVALMALGLDNGALMTGMAMVAIALFLLEPLVFPRHNAMWQRCYDFANECDVVIEQEQGSSPSAIDELSDAADAQSVTAHMNRIAAHFKLTPRELTVLRLLAAGRNANAISEKLFISYNTVKTHIYNIYRKTGVSRRQELLDLIETCSFAEDED